MASRRELLDSLKPGMHLDKNFFLKIYGYDITCPGFADDVIRRLEILGCSKARDYYTCIVSEYNHKHDQEMKRVSEWYAKQDTDKKGVSESRKQQEAEQQKAKRWGSLAKALNNLLDDTQRKYVTHLINEEDPISAAYIAFRAGMISGKRIERAKKRKDR